MAERHKYVGPSFEYPWRPRCCEEAAQSAVHIWTQDDVIRRFDSGATRDLDVNKPDYEGFLSPLVLERFGEYMNKHRQTAAGVRDSDNWQKGIPRPVYLKSLLRHVMDLWKIHRGLMPLELLEEALCAILFNAMGYLFEHLKEKRSGNPKPLDGPRS